MKFWIGCPVEIQYHGVVGAREVIPHPGTIGEIVEASNGRFDWLVRFKKPFICMHGYMWEYDDIDEGDETRIYQRVWLNEDELCYRVE